MTAFGPKQERGDSNTVDPVWNRVSLPQYCQETVGQVCNLSIIAAHSAPERLVSSLTKRDTCQRGIERSFTTERSGQVTNKSYDLCNDRVYQENAPLNRAPSSDRARFDYDFSSAFQYTSLINLDQLSILEVCSE